MKKMIISGIGLFLLFLSIFATSVGKTEVGVKEEDIQTTYINPEDHPADFIEVSGYISNKKEVDSFIIYCNIQNVELAFEYPEKAKFFVRVEGQYGDELGTFDLSEGGKYITLTGGGLFTIYIYSEKGKGEWSAWVTGGSND